MNNRKHYRSPKVQEDLYQYEMGIEVGADVEMEKQKHQKLYEEQGLHDQMNVHMDTDKMKKE